VIAAWASSGETASAYCRREGIPDNRFYQWRRRLGHATVAAPKATFIELTPPVALSGSGVVVVTPTGWRVELACGFDLATFQRVLSCGGAACSA
jgi:hypothetical protein